ncbi:MAG: COX15/CtaA family protein [Rufibacter sp.]
METRGSSKAVVVWLLTGALLIVVMVVIGGITRLTGSGLSMVEWNVLSGTLPPLSEAEWQATFSKYQQFPEYQHVNYSMSLTGFKEIFWWEYLHRLLGRVIGLVFLIPFLVFLHFRKFTKPLLKRLLFILFLGMLQGLMGWFMVKSGLIDKAHVSHYRLAAHLCLALALIGTILWTVADLTQDKCQQSSAHPQIAKLTLWVLLALLLQIILGAFVAGLKAGFYYNTFPLMNQEFFPVLLTEVLSWQNFMENGSLMQFMHRWVAWGVILLLTMLFFRSRSTTLSPTTKRWVQLMLATAGMQVGLGIATLLLQVPVALGVLHQVVAVVLFAQTVLMVHKTRPVSFVKEQAV